MERKWNTLITVTFFRKRNSRNHGKYPAENSYGKGKFSITFISIEDAVQYLINCNKNRVNVVFCPDGLTRQENILLWRKFCAVRRNQKDF